MASPPSCSTSQTPEIFKTILEQRSLPCLALFDEDLNVAFAEPRALALLEDFQSGTLQELLREHTQEVRKGGPVCERLLGPVHGFVLRVIPLHGERGNYHAVFFENEARREDLREAVRQYALTPREVEVLALVLDGKRAAEIADRLHITEATVFDHFRAINRKTNARNRGDMLAKVFNWRAHERARPIA